MAIQFHPQCLLETQRILRNWTFLIFKQVLLKVPRTEGICSPLQYRSALVATRMGGKNLYILYCSKLLFNIEFIVRGDCLL